MLASIRALTSLLITLFAIAGCQSDSDSKPGPVAGLCTPDSKKQALYDYALENYLWWDEIPTDLNLDQFGNTSELLDFIRREPEDRYSAVISLELAEEMLLGEAFGLGFSWAIDTDANLKIAMVYQGSSAFMANMQRGDTIVAINDIEASEIIAGVRDDIAIPERFLSQVLGSGATAIIDWIDSEGASHREALAITDYQVNSVHGASIIEHNEQQYGYFSYQSFIMANQAEINTNLDMIAQQGIDEIIVDLRHNGGGAVNQAILIANYLVAEQAHGQPIHQTVLNDNPNRTREQPGITYFDSEEYSSAVAFKKVSFLTTAQSCSSSETLISILSPYTEVSIIGGRTCGKPTGFRAEPACDLDTDSSLQEVFFVASTRSVNGIGETDYFDGLAATCKVIDEDVLPWGDKEDSLTAAALYYLETGTCPAQQNKLTKNKVVDNTAVRIITSGPLDQVSAF